MTRTYDARFQDKYGTDVPSGDGDCFQTALLTAIRMRDEYPDAQVVHGEPLGTGGDALGIRYPHAWTEVTKTVGNYVMTFVVDRSNGLDAELPASFYYQLGNIVADDVVRYSVDDAMTLAVNHGHYGPWD